MRDREVRGKDRTRLSYGGEERIESVDGVRTRSCQNDTTRGEMNLVRQTARYGQVPSNLLMANPEKSSQSLNVEVYYYVELNLCNSLVLYRASFGSFTTSRAPNRQLYRASPATNQVSLLNKRPCALFGLTSGLALTPVVIAGAEKQCEPEL